MEVFDRAFREELKERFTRRPEWEQPDLAFVALAPERARVREWIDAEVAYLPEPGRTKLVGRLRNNLNFATAYNELAVASILRDAGLDVAYEPDLQGLTPDLFVESGPDGRPLVIDVWTREVPRADRGARRAWAELVRRVARVPVPVGLVVQASDGGTPRPPTSGQAKEIAASLAAWLLRADRQPGSRHEVDGYRFIVFADLSGLRARLASPGPGGSIDSAVIIRALRTKVHRYRDLAEALGAHLVVVTATDGSAPLSVDFLRGALGGRQSFSFSFSPASSGLLASSTVRMAADERPITFDPVLSAVGFVEPRLADPELTLIPLQGAAEPVPPLLSDRIQVDAPV